jgi:hypothetical protein
MIEADNNDKDELEYQASFGSYYLLEERIVLLVANQLRFGKFQPAFCGSVNGEKCNEGR